LPFPFGLGQERLELIELILKVDFEPHTFLAYFCLKIMNMENRVNYKNGATTFANGRALYENGATAFANGRALYQNGATAFANGRSYYENGATLGSAVEINLSAHIRLYVDKNGASLTVCDNKVI
jgi:hypothetical protein